MEICLNIVIAADWFVYPSRLILNTNIELIVGELPDPISLQTDETNWEKAGKLADFSHE